MDNCNIIHEGTSVCKPAANRAGDAMFVYILSDPVVRRHGLETTLICWLASVAVASVLTECHQTLVSPEEKQ